METWKEHEVHCLSPSYKLPDCLPDFLPLLRNKAGILTESSTGSRSWSFSDSIKFNIILDQKEKQKM